MGFLNELWRNQPNILIGVGVSTLVLLVIYIKFFDISIVFSKKVD